MELYNHINILVETKKTLDKIQESINFIQENDGSIRTRSKTI